MNGLDYEAKFHELEAALLANGWAILRADGRVDVNQVPHGRLIRLQGLAQDIADNFRCDCYTDDLDSDDCPCGGDGRDLDGNAGALEGCWHCQALAALDSPQSASPAVPAPPQPPAAGDAAHVETGTTPPPGENQP
jgi:hypothetical protein